MKKMFGTLVICTLLFGCSQPKSADSSQPDLISFEEVKAVIQDQGIKMEKADLPIHNVFIQELNGVSPKAFSLDGETLSIYMFSTPGEIEQAREDFKKRTEAATVVEHEVFELQNVLVFYETGNEQIKKRISSALMQLKEKE